MTATDTQRQAAMILQGDPHTPALYRLLQPCEKRDELEREPMTQQQLLVDQPRGSDSTLMTDTSETVHVRLSDSAAERRGDRPRKG